MARPPTQIFALLLPLAGLAGLFAILQAPDPDPTANSRPALTSPAEVASRAEIVSRALAADPPQTATQAAASLDNETRQKLAKRREFFPDPEPDAQAAAPGNPHLPAFENSDPRSDPKAQALADFIRKTRSLSAHFIAWAKKYSETENESQRQTLLVEGLYRANLRGEVMMELMRRAPEEAVKRSLPLHVYHQLPDEIQARVETPFSALAKILPPENPAIDPPKNPFRRLRIQLPGEEAPLECIAYGRRSEMHPKEACAVQGIRLESLAVLREDVVQLLHTRDIPTARDIFTVANPDPDRCFASGHALADRFTVGLAGGKLLYFQDERILLDFNRRIGALDASPNPRLSSRSLFSPGAIPKADAGFNFAFARKAPRSAPVR